MEKNSTEDRFPVSIQFSEGDRISGSTEAQDMDLPSGKHKIPKGLITTLPNGQQSFLKHPWRPVSS